MQVTPLFQAGGTVRDNAFYVERVTDGALTHALRNGEYCYVLAPRQIGKSSLRARAERQLQAQGIRCASIDLTVLGSSEITQEEWYYGLVEEIGLRLDFDDLDSDPADFWMDNEALSPVHRWSRFLRDEVLEKVDSPIVIFVDEIDAVLSLPFPRDDFFASIRACFNARADDPAYERLTFCLLGVAAASDLIADPTRTPFNIGCDIHIEDFTVQEMQAFLPGLSLAKVSSQALLDEVYHWTSGHPYMTQRLFHHLVLKPWGSGLGIEDAVRQAVKELFLGSGGREDTNLVVAEKLFQGNPLKDQMLQVYRQLLAGIEIEANLYNPIHMALRLTGMVSSRKAHGSKRLWVRNQIFASVFDRAWVHGQETERLLNASLERWLLSGREDDYLLRGKALQEAQEWAATRDDLTVDERAFLLAGLNVAQEEERIRQKAERDRERREEAEARAQLQQRAIWGLGALVLALIGLLFFAFWQYRKAEQAKELERQAKDQAVLAQKGERRQKAKAEQALRQVKQALQDVKRAQGKTKQALVDAKKARKIANQQKQRAVRLLYQVGASLRKEKRARRIALRARKRAERLRAQESAARRRAEQAERAAQEGNKAISLAAQTGREMGALRAGILGVVPSLRSHRTPPLQALEGLIEAVNAARQTRGFRGHRSAVTRVRFLRKGRAFVSASRDQTVRLWDVETGRSFGLLQGHQAAIHAMDTSPKQDVVATGDDAGSVRLWDLTACLDRRGRGRAGVCQPTVRFVLKGHTRAVHTLALSPDGDWLASAGAGRTILLWNTRSGRLVRRLKGHRKRVLALSFSRRGSLLASADARGEIRLWGWTTGRLQKSWRAHRAPINTIDFSKRRLLSVSDDKTARLWDYQKAKQLRVWRGHNAKVTGGVFSPGGSFVLTTCADRLARLWSVKTGQRLRMLDAHTYDILDADFAPRGLQVLTGSRDKTARLWRPFRSDATLVYRRHNGFVNAAMFAKGKIVTASSDATVHLWDMQGRLRRRFRGHRSWVNDVAVKRGKLLSVSRDRTVGIWELATGRRVKVMPLLAWQEAIALSSAVGLFAVGGDDRLLRIFHGRTHRLIRALKGHQGSITSVAFSRDGRWLASGSQDQLLRLWDVRSGRLLHALEGHRKGITDVAFSPDHRLLLSASLDGTARLWLRKKGKRLSVLRGHRGKVLSAAFSPDGTRLATASSDRTVRIWDAQTARPIAILRGHQSSVLSVQFSPDGHQLLTGSMDRTARLFPASEQMYLRIGCRLLRHQREFAGLLSQCAPYARP